MADERPRVISRRELLKGAGVVGVAAAAGPAQVFGLPEPAAAPAAAQEITGAPPREAYEHLTAE